MKSLKPLLIILFSLFLSKGKSQKEFFVQVNRTTGIHSIMDSLPGVNFISQGASTFDKNNHRYFFYGIDFGGQNHLYCVNALTGSLISSPNCTLNMGELQYDQASNTLYALMIKNSIGKMFLISLDINTALPTIIDTLPFTGYSAGSTCFNAVNHNYIVQNGTTLYSMNATTGSLSSVTFTKSFISPCFDNTSGFIYGIVISGPSMNLAKINLATGTFSAVGNFTFSGTSSVYNTYDEINQVYSLGSSGFLHSISVNTGSVISSPSFPQGLTGNQNVIELHYDNSNGNLFALHWGPVVSFTTSLNEIPKENCFNIMPNPAGSNTMIYLGKQSKDIIISIHTALGELVLKKAEQNVMAINITLDQVPKGVYFISVEADHKYWGTKKIIVD